MAWYFQLTQRPQENVRCFLKYDNSDYEFSIDENNTLGGNFGTCFSPTPDRYWLKLDNACTEKTFQVSCNDTILANFLFKRANDWYVIGQTEQAPPLEVLSINLSATYCISRGQGCNYESTLWTAYAFYLAGKQETARTFMPYLVMKANETENKKFLPQAFLYKLTGRDSYADEIKALQGMDGLITAPGTSYGKYHDTSLAIITGSTSKANMTKIHDTLLKQQKTDGSWDCGASCDTVRDTAMLLLTVWPSFEYRSECEQQGFRCVSNCSAVGISEGYECFTGECCNMTFNCDMAYGTCKISCAANETQISYTCDSNKKCCKSRAQARCSEINGSVCNSTQECVNSQGSIIPFNVTPDSNLCCIGTCTTRTKTCQELTGVYCNPSDGKSCNNNDWLTALDTLYCCKPSSCVTGSLTCYAQGGYICTSTEDCEYGVFIVASDTQGQQTCCVQGGTCVEVQSTCSDEQGTPCELDEECVGGTTKQTSDTRRCCIDGQCMLSCSGQGGTPCNSSLTCKGTIRQASDVSRCCIGTCEKKAGFSWLTVIIIFVIIALAIVIFFLVKTGKLKFKKKAKIESLGISGFEFPSARPSVMPSARPMPTLKPLKPLGPLQPRPMQKPMAKPAMKPLGMPTTKPMLRPIQPGQPQLRPLQKPMQPLKKKLPPPPLPPKKK
jgi:hypothetical protein